MKKKIALIMTLALTMGLTVTGCGSKTENAQPTGGKTVYAVEAGSAGEAAAQEKGFSYNSVASQADALMEVASGTSDAAIIDLLMAGAMIGEGTSYPDMKYTEKLTTEEYGVGFRKGSDVVDEFNKFLAASIKDGSMEKCAEKYGVQAAVIKE